MTRLGKNVIVMTTIGEVAGIVVKDLGAHNAPAPQSRCNIMIFPDGSEAPHNMTGITIHDNRPILPLPNAEGWLAE